MALKAKFHKLVALTPDVWGGKICLSLPVRGGDDLCWSVNAALELAHVSASYIMWIDRVVFRVVACLAVRCVGAIRSIQSIKEGVEHVNCCYFFRFIDVIVGLVECDGLRIDERSSRVCVSEPLGSL
jgi:hypothetical protein